MLYDTWRRQLNHRTYVRFASTEIVKFREMLEERLERGDDPLDAIPDDHKPLIAKMAHERCVAFSSSVGKEP